MCGSRSFIAQKRNESKSLQADRIEILLLRKGGTSYTDLRLGGI